MSFCPKCGSQVVDGAPFCSNCGANLGATQFTGAPAAPKTPSLLGEAFKTLFSKGFVAPIEAAETSSTLHNGAALIVLGAYALLAFFMMMIHLPIEEASKYISVGNRTLFGLAPLFVIVLSTLIRTVFAYVFGKAANPQISFMQLFAKFAALKLYPCALFFLMFLFGLFSSLLAFIALAVGLIMWIGFSDILFLKHLAAVAENKRTWFLVLASGVSFFVSALFVYIFTKVALGSIFGGLF